MTSKTTKTTSTSVELPVFDLSLFLKKDPTASDDAEVKKTCKEMAKALHETSILIVKDPRVTTSDSGSFIDMMEDYFSQDPKQLQKDVRADIHYQVGATPEFIEKAICANALKCKDLIDEYAVDSKPTLKKDHGADPKWRFFWRIGNRPEKSEYPELNAKQVVPQSPQFKDRWANVMNAWGNKMITALSTTAEMIATGFDLPRDTFVNMMKNGPHLLAPTGSNLGKYDEPETVFATFHKDLNFLTIHGKSRYPGLYIWLRDGTKMPVKIPDGCLLVQAGMQIEHLTGGYVRAGYHEVIATEASLAVARRRKAEGRPPWRISSTLFGHIQSDQILRPLGKFGEAPGARLAYPEIKAGAQVATVLREIELATK